MQQRFCNTPTSSESIRVIRSSVLDAFVVMSSVISRLMQLRVATRFARECHKDFSRVRLVENALQKLCNLSHRDSSCTVARSSNRVILDPALLAVRAAVVRAAAPRYIASSSQSIAVIPRVICRSPLP